MYILPQPDMAHNTAFLPGKAGGLPSLHIKLAGKSSFTNEPE
jgi:hypothetical protein